MSCSADLIEVTSACRGMTRAPVVSACLLPLALGAQAPSVPEDFAIRFEGGLCSGDTIDTFKGTYTRHIDVERAATATIRLSPDQRQRLFELVTVVGFFVYPESFNPRTPWVRIPAPLYVITVRVSGVEHTVRWNDMDSPLPEAERLRQFIRGVYTFFEAFPDVRSLPKQEAGCA